MNYELRKMTSSTFFSKINTGTLIEERIKLMLVDTNIDGICFADGEFSYRLKEGRHEDLPTWEFTLEETIHILTIFCERVKEVFSLSEDIAEGSLIFEDCRIGFDNFEIYPYGDPEDGEHSLYSFYINKFIEYENDLELPF